MIVLPNGKQFLSAGFDDHIKMWNLKDFSLLKILYGYDGSVSCLATIPWGVGEDHALLSGTSIGGHAVLRPKIRVSLLNTQTSSRTRDFENCHQDEVRCVSLGVSFGRTLMASGGADKLLRIWDLYAGSFLISLPVHDDAVLCVAMRIDQSNTLFNKIEILSSCRNGEG